MQYDTSHMLLIAPLLMHLVMAVTDAVVRAIIMINAVTPNTERVMHRPTKNKILGLLCDFALMVKMA